MKQYLPSQIPLSSSDGDFEVLLDTVDVLPVYKGIVCGLVVDQLAGVG